MARNNESKSLAEAKTSGRRLAARMEPALAASEPRDFDGSNPAASGEPLGRRADEGENATTPLFVVVTFPARDEPLLPSKQGRPRRCYEEEEKRQVADTRRRGACEGCRASKTKCLHDPSEIATEKYRMQSQSHELFALGLTTPSLTANEDEHKQMMKKTITAFDDKLVKAQKDPSTQNHEANNGGSVKTIAVVVPLSPPEPTIPKVLSSQKPNSPAKVVQARQTRPIQFQQGLKTFKLNEGQKQKYGSPWQRSKDNSKAATNATLGRRTAGVRKASASLQPIVCQQQSIGSVLSTNAVMQPSSQNLIQGRPNPQGAVVGRTPTTPTNIQLGCKAFQASAISVHLKAPSALPLKSKPEWLTTRRSSDSSDQDSHTMATDESMLSFGRSPSPSSEHPSSNPPPFVHLSDLERSKSHDRAVPDASVAILSERLAHEQRDPFARDMLAMQGIEAFSYEKLLYDENGITSPSDDTYPYPAAFESGNAPPLDNTAKAAFPEPDFMPMDMDLDDPL